MAAATPAAPVVIDRGEDKQITVNLTGNVSGADLRVYFNEISKVGNLSAATDKYSTSAADQAAGYGRIVDVTYTAETDTTSALLIVTRTRTITYPVKQPYLQLASVAYTNTAGIQYFDDGFVRLKQKIGLIHVYSVVSDEDLV